MSHVPLCWDGLFLALSHGVFLRRGHGQYLGGDSRSFGERFRIQGSHRVEEAGARERDDSWRVWDLGTHPSHGGLAGGMLWNMMRSWPGSVRRTSTPSTSSLGQGNMSRELVRRSWMLALKVGDQEEGTAGTQ